MAPTLKEVQAAVGDQWDLTDPPVACVIGGLFVGADVTKVSKLTGIPVRDLRECGQRLAGNGIWVGGKMAVDNPDDVDGIELTMAILVARGLMECDTGRDRTTYPKRRSKPAVQVPRRRPWLGEKPC